MTGMDALLRPASVCVVGVSSRRPTRGNMAIRNLQALGFRGRILPVRPQAAELEGLKAVPSIEALPPGVDVAFVAVPAGDVAGVILRLDRAGVKAAVVITAGFSPEQEATLREVAGRVALLMHGPNCMGLLNFSDNVPLYSAEFPATIRPGRVALLAQSGSAAIAVMNTLRAGFSKVVTVGSEFRLTATDYLDWLAEDDATSVTGVILEAIQSPDAFAAAVRKVHAAGKSVVVLKVGRSVIGERAAQAHTGAMITPATAYECFFRDLGVPTVSDYDQLAGALLALAACKPAGGGGVAVTGISGGETALMCDLVAESGLRLAEWSAETEAAVREALPGTTGRNPLDVWASLRAEDTDGHLTALEAIAADPAVGTIIAVQDLQATLPRQLSGRYRHPMGMVAALRQRTDKPVLVLASTPDPLHPDLAALLEQGGVPVMQGLWAGLGALRALAVERPTEHEPPAVLDLASLQEEIRRHSGPLPNALCQQILARYQIPFVRSLTTGPDGTPPEGLTFPVVVKVASSGIAHRSEIGGVALGIADAESLRRAVADIRASVASAAPDRVIDGFEIQEQLSGCVEAMAGFSMAPPFGPLTIVGTGGVLAELQADRAATLGWIPPARAAQMIEALRLGRVLGGYRNLVPPTRLDGLARLVSNLTRLARDLGDVIAECDLNPVLVRPGSGEATAVDVLMIAR